MTNGSDNLVAVVATGVANVASVMAALRRLGREPYPVSSASEVMAAQRLVLPGVGAFAAAMQRLMELGLVEPLRERIAAERPTLAICLGLQLLAGGSDENPGVRGLDIVDGQVVPLPARRRPQLGWNRVAPGAESRYIKEGYAYYANSFCLTAAPAGWVASWSHCDDRFVAAIERGPVLACQFHPELSGAWGRECLARWWEATGC